jgi:predicted RNase H-like HicB family nuclease
MKRVLVVRAEWDAEASTWVAYSDDVPGLATGADSMEDLVQKLKTVVPELLEENGLLAPPPADLDIPFFVLAQRIEHARRSS